MKRLCPVLILLVSINIAGAITPDFYETYKFNAIQGMSSAGSSSHFLNEGQSLTQSFRLDSDGLIGAYNRNGSNDILTYALSDITVYVGGYIAIDSTSTFRLEVFESDGTTLVDQVDLVTGIYGKNNRTFVFDTPLDLALDTSYLLKITYILAGTPAYVDTGVKFYKSASDYPDGLCNLGGDIWFKSNGTSQIPGFTFLTVQADAGNAYFYDPGYDMGTTPLVVKSKLLGVMGHLEMINVSNGGHTLTYVVDDTTIATAQQTGGGTVDTLTLDGCLEGHTYLFIKNDDQVIDLIRLQSYRPRLMHLSYSYIAYPGETVTWMHTASTDITEFISNFYAQTNIAIDWTDNGILEFEWDLDGDGQSWDASYAEMHSPLNYGILPTPEVYFSNIYMLRFNKDNNYFGSSNGGGTSVGFGHTSGPSRLAIVRSPVKPLNYAFGRADTLAHELAHNLGLWHVNSGADQYLNLMKTGRAASALFAAQWDVLHNMLKVRMPLEPGVEERFDLGFFSVLAGMWGQSDCDDCGTADLDGDQDVDFQDLILVAENWL